MLCLHGNKLTDTYQPKAGDPRARNWRKFSSKFSYLCVDEQYMSNMTSTRNRRNLLKNLRKFLYRMLPV